MESNDMGSLMRFLHDDGEYHKTGLTITEASKKLAPSAKVPQQTPMQSKPDVDHEALGVETYEDEDLTKVKSQTPKNAKYAVRKVADKEVETPIPVVKPPTKESKIGTLYLCNECFKTFRNTKAKCIHCPSIAVEPIVQIKEGVLELVGEVPGISVSDQKILQLAINTDVISDEWPSDEEMTDALSSLEDIVDPEQESPDMDLKMSYLKHVLIPKALSMHEGKVPSDKDDSEEKIVQKLTEEEQDELADSSEEVAGEEEPGVASDKKLWDKIAGVVGEALQTLNLGYYHSSTHEEESGVLFLEFTSVSGGPLISVTVS
jgi:hypothetical protein